jgi:hypothetical protein
MVGFGCGFVLLSVARTTQSKHTTQRDTQRFQTCSWSYTDHAWFVLREYVSAAAWSQRDNSTDTSPAASSREMSGTEMPAVLAIVATDAIRFELWLNMSVHTWYMTFCAKQGSSTRQAMTLGTERERKTERGTATGEISADAGGCGGETAMRVNVC